MMRRMLDEFDVSPFGAGGFGTSPFSMMRRMFNDMERMFENLDIPDVDQGMSALEWAPQIDVMRQGNDLVVRADLPGINQDQIQVYAQDNAIVIEGERNDVREDNRGDVWRSERFYGHFRRVVPVPEGSNPENAVARYDNGVLEVTLPLPESSRGRRIQIQSSSQGERQGQGQLQNAPSQSGQSQKSERH
jgi:HSP20 family protein